MTAIAERLPAAAGTSTRAREELLAFTAFPREVWRQIWSNPQEWRSAAVRAGFERAPEGSHVRAGRLRIPARASGSVLVTGVGQHTAGGWAWRGPARRHLAPPGRNGANRSVAGG
ncbi:transposase [Dactylosporangium sp. NPDC000521]|uniref:transposase n=1 Tax=Dactylosporangium sp. NPDC000521 TaxID=3363975 RepID=UPI00369BCFEC